MENSISTFGLTEKQMVILFSLQCYLTRKDADKTSDSDETSKKTTWLYWYKANLSEFMSNFKGDKKPQILTSVTDIKQAIMQESEEAETELWKYMVLLECSLFTPYFPLSEDDAKKKTYKGLSMAKQVRKDELHNIASWLKIDYDYVERFESQYKSAIKQMTGYWKKVLIGTGIGIAAVAFALVTWGGAFVALFAAEGLVGIAAINSGLAALGGGAIAAGGFGMAGGIAVLVGGGLLLGTGAGASISMALATTSPDAVMHESAKMYVVLKEIVIGIQHDTKRCQEILGTIIDKISEYKKEIARLRQEIEEDKEKIKNLEKSVAHLEKFVKMASA